MIGQYQYGNAFLCERFLSLGTRLKNQPTLSMFVVVDGHAPFEVAAGEKAVRPQADAADGPQLVRLRLTFQDAAVDEAVLELVEADFRWVGGFGPLSLCRTRVQLLCSHSKCTGSIEFSWHWNQLQGISEKTICMKPLRQVKLPVGHQRHRLRPR